MEKFQLKNYINGWLIGDFDPAIHRTDQFEIAVKHYKMGDVDPTHFHKIATEFTIIMSGCVQMNDEYLCEGDVVKVNPNEITAFKAVTDATLVAIKIPSVIGDKYLKE